LFELIVGLILDDFRILEKLKYFFNSIFKYIFTSFPL